MVGLTHHHRYFLFRGATDMRKGFDGLSGLVQHSLGLNPTDGSVYIFINRRRDRMKLLVWEPGGFMLYYKRLEKGTFELPAYNHQSNAYLISWQQLILIIEGVSLQSVRQRKRYRRA